MKTGHDALEYAALLDEYLEKLGLQAAFDINPEYPEWAGSISIAPDIIHCNDIDWPMKLLASPQLFVSDDGEIRIRYDLPVKISANSPFSCDETGFSADDELRILRILHESYFDFNLRINHDYMALRLPSSCFMTVCTCACAKGTAHFIREQLYTACSELERIIPRAYFEPLHLSSETDWANRPYSVRHAKDIAAYINSTLSAMQAAQSASVKQNQRHISEWDPAWGDPIEVLLHSKEEYEKTGSASALFMYSVATDYMYWRLARASDDKK